MLFSKVYKTALNYKKDHESDYVAGFFELGSYNSPESSLLLLKDSLAFIPHWAGTITEVSYNALDWQRITLGPELGRGNIKLYKIGVDDRLIKFQSHKPIVKLEDYVAVGNKIVFGLLGSPRTRFGRTAFEELQQTLETLEHKGRLD